MTQDWKVFRGEKALEDLPPPPPWRNFASNKRKTGEKFNIDELEINLVNAAIYLRRPLLITGPPGIGKSSLAHAVAAELGLGKVLEWPISSRSTVNEALYRYDPIERLRFVHPTFSPMSMISWFRNRSTSLRNEDAYISDFLRLGPLGTAFAASKVGRPQVLLIDEIDKSDIDLPNDLLHVFEDGRFEIPEISRLKLNSVFIRSNQGDMDLEILNGWVICQEFPIVFITSNGERDLPAPFLRRCLSLDVKPPSVERLVEITVNHLQSLIFDNKDDVERDNIEVLQQIRGLAEEIVRRQQNNEYVATDQLLNTAYLILEKVGVDKVIETESESGAKTPRKLADFLLKTISYVDFNR